MRDFGELIRDTRKEKGHTIRSLEKALLKNQNVHASNSFINLIEKGKRKPTYEIAYALAKELAIEPKTALRSAYLARLDFDKSREKENLINLKTKRNIRDLNVDEIVM